jgi:hypothetical protein
MMWNEHDRDPEAPWRNAESSAGTQTQYFSGAPGALTPAARRRNNLIAFALLGVGILMLIARLTPWRGRPRMMETAPGMGSLDLLPSVPAIDVVPGMILFTIASVFLFFAFWRRMYPLIIPGFILTGLSVGVTLVDLTGGVSVLWGLALGFLAIYLVGRALWRMDAPWPLIPGSILFAVGIIVAMTQLGPFFAASLAWLPLVLIGAGIYLGWMRR